MTMGILDIIIFSTIVQISIFAVFLTVQGLGKRRELLFLSLFFLSLVLYMLNQLVLRRVYDLYPEYMHLLYIGAPFGLLYAPCFYLYLRRSREGSVRHPLLVPLHFIPFLALSGYLLATFYFQDAGNKGSLLRDPSFLLNSATIWFTIAVQAQSLFYVALGLRALLRHKRRLTTHGHSREYANDAWLAKLGVGLAILLALDFLRFVSRIWGLLRGGILASFSRGVLPDAFEIALYVFFAGFSYFILFNAIRRPQALLGRDDAANQRKSLSDRTAESYKKELLSIMEKRKPHLEPELSLSDLSCLTGIPSRSLSEVIRKCECDNFYDFVNEFRVKEFIRFLADPSLSHQTVLTLMFEAGFNSKSVFNKVFKKKTGRNPRRFIKERTKSEK
ncbi:MAG: AraC family transcriptional regulator [Spirochaetales bacterium]|nr:AraC family transcriptional regulator [Spirochaetales bacterium]